MTPDLLTSIFGVILSLLASYLPGFSTWYSNLQTESKRLVMAAGLLIISAAIAGLSCAGYGAQIGVELTCDTFGAWNVIRAFLAALAINQATYLITRA
jgi:hypothetical protein